MIPDSGQAQTSREEVAGLVSESRAVCLEITNHYTTKEWDWSVRQHTKPLARVGLEGRRDSAVGTQVCARARE